ncbi:cyclic peptide export ABC transporter [Chitinophaga sp.]|uniref:cyclic peptide export ABC transporter n=1 Tax=Chitinophaga sp. TaxID=1869181 RepID=UPI0031DE4A23
MRRLLKAVMPLLGIGGLIKFIVLGMLSGVSSFLLLHFINKAIGLILQDRFGSRRLEYALIFAGIILLFIIARRMLSLGIIYLSQSLFWNIRKQILSTVLGAGYAQMKEKKMEIQAAIVADVNVLTNVSLTLIGFFTSSILVAGTLIYLACISLVLFAATLVVAITGALIYHFGSKKINRRFQQARKLERNFLGSMNAILDGFREIYMEPRKGKAIYDEKIRSISREGFKNSVEGLTMFLNNQVTGQVLFYMLISSILLLLGVVIHIKMEDTVSFVLTLLYLLGALETILTSLPGIMRATISSDRLLDLTISLEGNNIRNRLPREYISRAEFDNIIVSNLSFQYTSIEQGFSIGPVDLEIRKGDTIFIYGGNGSGKTTFLYTLTGLNVHTGGEIKVNGKPVTPALYPEYKTLFSVIFSDFYLFKELFGISNLDIGKWEHYLHLFELEGKVTLEGKSLSTTDLSMGQRKRLALIVSLLEEKPVLILDEWAADQDPYFRKKFYTAIIPALKQEGFTIIAITHDDKYYHCADKLFKMEDGRLTEQPIDTYTTNFY